jgi:hypothetical protein
MTAIQESASPKLQGAHFFTAIGITYRKAKTAGILVKKRVLASIMA